MTNLDAYNKAQLVARTFFSALLVSRTSAEVDSWAWRSCDRRSSLSRGVPSRLVSLLMDATVMQECQAWANAIEIKLNINDSAGSIAPLEFMENMLLEIFWLSCLKSESPSAANASVRARLE